MAEREELLAAVRSRLQRAQAGQDESLLLEPAALAEAERLTRLLDDQDVEARYYLGWLHWNRCLALPEGQDQEDLDALLAMFTFCFVHGISDEALPKPLLPYLADGAATTAVATPQRVLGSAEAAATTRLWQRILTHTPTDHPNHADRAAILNDLGNALQVQFERSEVLSDLDTAIDARRQAVEATPTGHPDRAAMLSNLGNALRVRFERSGALGDLDAAISVGREAVEATPTGHPDRAICLSSLGITLRARFEHFGADPDLDAAISVGREAVEATPTGHPDRAAMLSNLVAALQRRFERSGTLADLDTVIDARRQAVEPTPTGRAMQLSLLGNALQRRFERSGTLADLDTVIDARRQAVEATPTGHPDRAAMLSNLVSALLDRVKRSGAVPDLDAAISVGREAVDATPTDYPNRNAIYVSLGNALLVRFERSGALADLETGIGLYREAVEATPTDHPDRAIYLNNLGNGLRARFERSGAVPDLDAAICVGREAVEATPTDRPDRAICLNSLGNALQRRFERSGADLHLDTLEEAVQTQALAAQVTAAAPSVRIRAGRAAGDWLATSDPGRAASLLEGAVRLLPEVAPRGLDRSDQQELLGELAGVAGDAAALAMADMSAPVDERAGRALRLLESGRGRLLAQVIEIRGDLTDLRALHPDLADQFIELRDLLDLPLPRSTSLTGISAGPTRTQAREAWDRRQVAATLGRLQEHIRSLGKEFTSFGLPPTVEVLRGQAGQGPVVTFNINRFRSDALLLTEQGVTAVALPDLTPAAVIARINAFHQALADSSDPAPNADRGAAQQRVREILAWLWDTAVGPVLGALDCNGYPADGQEWPRVWWATGGLLSLLPLHAAGHHTSRHDPGFRTRTALDRVISSYTPTVGALGYARQHTAPPPAQAQAQALIVAMPSTPGLQRQGRLSDVARETTQLQALLPHPILLTEPDVDSGTAGTGDQTPTRTAVFAHLAEVTIAHFACHGYSHPTDPSQSLLLLHDWQQDPLTVASLAPVNLDHARLAYLSACSTTLTRSPQLLDESIHLTAAFQLAGFPHVIGTLWEINDKYAADIANSFYTRLTDSKDNIDTERAAHALHDTIRSLRDQLPLTPSLWAAHLHSGA